MLPDGALADERTRSRLGDDALEDVLASLWPGDCQSCGQSLGGEPPVLLVDDLGLLTRASLHYPACRPRAWNDSSLITTSSSGLVSWRTVVMLLPFRAGGEEIWMAGLLVNSGLEGVWLVVDGDAWHPRLDPGFAAAGLSSPAAGIPIGIPAAGVTGRLADGCLSAAIAGRAETYETWAEPEIGAQACQHGGFLLIVTHAVHPAQLTPEGLDQALASPVTLVGWAQLDSGAARPR
jgi:hypothetical protein